MSDQKKEISQEELTNAGERMIVGNMWGYWAHLSIYNFALPFARGRRVLDAGSGAGYGAAYLARHGAKVLALDAGPVAIEHSRQRYAGDTVTFEVADLSMPLDLGDGVFDLVFSSNVFEHVGDVDGLAAECARVMAPDGVTIVAVPPVCSALGVTLDMENHFHVHHLPPTAWQAKLQRYFLDVRCHAHAGLGVFADKAREQAEIRLTPDQVTIRETDFEFPETSPEAMVEASNSITAVFVCRGRRLPIGAETLAERMPASWREGEIAAKLIARLRTDLAEAEAKNDNLLQASSTQVSANTDISAIKRQLQDAQDKASAAEEKVKDVAMQMRDVLNRASAAEQEVRDITASKQASDARVMALETSTIWRSTAPVRSLVNVMRRRG